MGNKTNEAKEKELEREKQDFWGKGNLLQQTAERLESDPMVFQVDLLKLLGVKISSFLHQLGRSLKVGYVIGPKFIEGEIKANSAYFKFSEIGKARFPIKEDDDLWLRVEFRIGLKSSLRHGAIVIMKERIETKEMTVSHLSNTFSQTVEAALLFLEQ